VTVAVGGGHRFVVVGRHYPVARRQFLGGVLPRGAIPGGGA